MPPPRITIGSLHADLAASAAYFRADTSAVQASRARVEAATADGRAHYGINTGFGVLANKRVPDDQLHQLQRNLLLSHAVGVGEPVPPDVTRVMLRAKIHGLGLGYSGVSLPTFRRLLDFDERGLLPVVPSRGSVGASGDLAPLAHLCLPLIGHGEFWNDARTAPVPAAEVLRRHNLPPLELGAKDGLALINGTQLMSGYGAFVLEKCTRLVDLFDLTAAMSLEALQGSIRPFDPRIHAVRPHPGHGVVAANVRRLLADSEILESHRNCGKVQDPYCLRCVPQVHGASRDALAYAAGVLETELNGVTDNPLVFDNGDIVSGGNFHGQPLALALDFAAIALAELASISERRVYLLLEGHDGLPKLLMRETGLNSGFMIPQYTAAALVSENKVLCHPASVDSIPTSLGQEDHVSMGSISAVKLLRVFENVETVLAIEVLTAAQALDYRQPLRPGRGVEAAHRVVRAACPHHEADYLFREDLEKAFTLVRGRALLDAAGI
ncbi:histidine ammonia-lyase : Histidine ammonia-lyase OS=Rhodothermus marinus SG0.5JP17-172 GN=Rhom172_1197 PE=3 SV=1: Lyase_aromatic [Gemmataceae bacterium]|nr:histidine ammonia-lyase : Histidine ammonia-lyase OS=Rhodothermus marinus SG0.5JP17-172 GN=Rhom172_1197 PE=3 SV=1: Lyase_aromatic [Gemmataceae bacterium]VTT97066.1 histidine ammonia-lyase : Histidine ammonia-lyase OS=Rhodothermus marinus SG0.5JP17-172 GN=Rhom172_1197 PE=3 SV=1: Lyase_aromatic [Gemmataceae bacterium]